MQVTHSLSTFSRNKNPVVLKNPTYFYFLSLLLPKVYCKNKVLPNNKTIIALYYTSKHAQSTLYSLYTALISSTYFKGSKPLSYFVSYWVFGLVPDGFVTPEDHAWATVRWMIHQVASGAAVSNISTARDKGFNCPYIFTINNCLAFCPWLEVSERIGKEMSYCCYLSDLILYLNITICGTWVSYIERS